MSNVFFTADTHLGHSRILAYANRPFSNHLEMEEELITRFNEVLRPGDRLYHLGDVSWSSYDLKRFFNRLNTNQIHLVWGNHDNKKRTRHPFIRSYSDIKNVSLDGGQVVLCHYPMRSWLGKGYGAYHLYGHCHGNIENYCRSMDVGVDTHNFYPWEWSEIKSKLQDQPFFHEDDTDHHSLAEAS